MRRYEFKYFRKFDKQDEAHLGQNQFGCKAGRSDSKKQQACPLTIRERNAFRMRVICLAHVGMATKYSSAQKFFPTCSHCPTHSYAVGHFFPLLHHNPHVALKVNTTTKRLPRAKWIEQCPLKSLQQLDKYFVEFYKCHRLAEALVPARPENEVVVALHPLEFFNRWLVASGRG